MSSSPKEVKALNNGADDYFLWILMFMQGNKFALNQNILFKQLIPIPYFSAHSKSHRYFTF